MARLLTAPTIFFRTYASETTMQPNRHQLRLFVPLPNSPRLRLRTTPHRQPRLLHRHVPSESGGRRLHRILYVVRSTSRERGACKRRCHSVHCYVMRCPFNGETFRQQDNPAFAPRICCPQRPPDQSHRRGDVDNLSVLPFYHRFYERLRQKEQAF